MNGRIDIVPDFRISDGWFLLDFHALVVLWFHFGCTVCFGYDGRGNFWCAPLDFLSPSFLLKSAVPYEMGILFQKALQSRFYFSLVFMDGHMLRQSMPSFS